MWLKPSRAAFAAAWLFVSLANAIPHGDEDMNMDMGMEESHSEPPPDTSGDNSPMSYFAYGKHSGTIMAHIALMVLAWCFILPIGRRRSVAITGNLLTSSSGHVQHRALEIRAALPIPLPAV